MDNYYPISEKCAEVILDGFAWARAEGEFDEMRCVEMDDLLLWIGKTYPALKEKFRYLPFPEAL